MHREWFSYGGLVNFQQVENAWFSDSSWGVFW